MIPDAISNIKSRIHIVHILLIQLLAQQLHTFSESLEMDDLPLTKELDHIIHIRIIRKAKDIVIGDPGLLFWYVRIMETNIRRKNGNKRLITTKNDSFLPHILLQIVCVRAVLTEKYRKKIE